MSSLLYSTAAVIGSATMRNPAATGGTVVFFIVFSFVAANALWYQPSAHPHPWLDTRDAFRSYAAHAMNAGSAAVTTFRIERDVEQPAAQPQAQQPAAKTVAQPQPSSVVQVIEDQTAAAPAPPAEGTTLVAEIQKNLARRGLYDGAVDGMMGPKTEAAILFYQQTRGLPETGNPEQSVLDLLKQDNAEFSVIPPERPTPDVTGAITQAAKPAPNAAPRAAPKPAPKAANPDPVARLISKATPPKAVAATPATPSATPASAPSGDLVLQIQKGLSKYAYKNVTVDGVAGEQTREAIRHFQKHYNLPVTGEPDEAVLKKLKQIGAI